MGTPRAEHRSLHKQRGRCHIKSSGRSPRGSFAFNAADTYEGTGPVPLYFWQRGILIAVVNGPPGSGIPEKVQRAVITPPGRVVIAEGPRRESTHCSPRKAGRKTRGLRLLIDFIDKKKGFN